MTRRCSDQPTAASRAGRLLGALAALTFCFCGMPALAETYAYAAVKDAGVSAQNLALGNYEFVDESLALNGALASAQGPGNIAQAQTLPGVNRVSVSNSAWVSDEELRETGWGGPFAVGMSIWTDEFTITGGTGVGRATVSVNVTGQFGSGVGAQGGYGLWMATPSDLQRERDELLRADPLTWLGGVLDDPEDVGVTNVLSYQAWVPTPGYFEPGYLTAAPNSLFGGTFVATIDFIYGQPFWIASGLYGFANDTGSLSAMNSAHFGVSVQGNAGAQILSLSGASYAAAVPEPTSWVLLVVGLAMLGWTSRDGSQRMGGKASTRRISSRWLLTPVFAKML